MKLSVETGPKEFESIWLDAPDHLQMAIRNAVLMCFPALDDLEASPELEFDAPEDGVLLVSYKPLNLKVRFNVKGKVKGKPGKNRKLDLTLVEDTGEIEIEIPIPDEDYSPIY